MTPELHIQDLAFAYPDSTPVFQHFTASFSAGITGLIGGNGSGKTTLMKLLSGQVHGAMAQIQWKGLEPRTDTLFLPEHSELPQYVTAEEILDLAGIPLLGNPLVDILDLHSFRSRIIRRCSLGMRKRLVLALALARKAKLLLLDEPFTGIDVDTLLRLKDYLLHQPERTSTISVITSHQLDYLSEISQTLLILKNGTTLFSGTCEQLLQKTKAPNPLMAYHSINHQDPSKITSSFAT